MNGSSEPQTDFHVLHKRTPKRSSGQLVTALNIGNIYNYRRNYYIPPCGKEQQPTIHSIDKKQNNLKNINQSTYNKKRRIKI